MKAVMNVEAAESDALTKILSGSIRKAGMVSSSDWHKIILTKSYKKATEFNNSVAFGFFALYQEGFREVCS